MGGAVGGACLGGGSGRRRDEEVQVGAELFADAKVDDLVRELEQVAGLGAGGAQVAEALRRHFKLDQGAGLLRAVPCGQTENR